jgi:hypothetical protein
MPILDLRNAVQADAVQVVAEEVVAAVEDVEVNIT